MSTFDDLRTLGYSVAVAFTPEGDSATPVYHVEGYGLSTYVNGYDQGQIDSLADPMLHAARIAPTPAPPPASDPLQVLCRDAVVALDALPPSATLPTVVAALKNVFGA